MIGNIYFEALAETEAYTHTLFTKHFGILYIQVCNLTLSLSVPPLPYGRHMSPPPPVALFPMMPQQVFSLSRVCASPLQDFLFSDDDYSLHTSPRALCRTDTVITSTSIPQCFSLPPMDHQEGGRLEKIASKFCVCLRLSVVGGSPS